MEQETEVKFIATVTGVKGTCHAHHTLGQQFELNCYDSGGSAASFTTTSSPI